MCQNCVDQLATVNENFLALLEAKRHEFTALISTSNAEIAKFLTITAVPEDLPANERKALEERIASQLPAISLVIAMGYAITANDHDSQLVDILMMVFSIALEIGHMKSGSEQHQAKLN